MFNTLLLSHHSHMFKLQVTHHLSNLGFLSCACAFPFDALGPKPENIKCSVFLLQAFNKHYFSACVHSVSLSNAIQTLYLCIVFTLFAITTAEAGIQHPVCFGLTDAG